METQLICFIDPVNFYYLLGETKAGIIGFPNNDPNLLGYINRYGSPKFATFNPTEAKNAAILIVPDSFDLYKYYKPDNKFKILYHSKTDKELRVNPFIKHTEYEGSEESREYKNTVYNDIALFIGNNQDEDIKSFDDIYSKIRKTNMKLEAILDFLHQCLNRKPEELPVAMSNTITKKLFEQLPNDITDKGYNTTLAVLRNAMLKDAGVEV